MKVRFPDGRPVIWWPASEEGAGIKPQGQEVTDSLSWRLFLGRQPDGRGPFGARPRTPAVAADHWYAKARMVKAEPVFSRGGHGRGGTFIDAEQFVYYDGLMTPLAFLKARRTATGDLVLDNTAPYPLHDLWCVDHTGDKRTGGGPRLARVPLVPVGTKEIAPEWRAVPALARKLLDRQDGFATLCMDEVTPEVATLIVASDRWSGNLPRLAVLSPEVAAALVAAQKWDGQLPGVTAFERPDSVAAATALAKRQGPLALPNLERISPKTLSALITKEDVQIPLIETLELIREPDGSATDEFVIPKGFQERQ